VPNKLVRRDVVRVVTPGTLLEEHILERSTHNYLAAITAFDDVIALAHADISTGHVAATAFDGESALEDVLAEISRLRSRRARRRRPGRRARGAGRSARGGPDAHRGAGAGGGGRARARSRSTVSRSTRRWRCTARSTRLGAFVRRVSVQQNGGTSLRRAAVLPPSDVRRARPNTRKHLELTKALGANPRATLLATIDRTRTADGFAAAPAAGCSRRW